MWNTEHERITVVCCYVKLRILAFKKLTFLLFIQTAILCNLIILCNFVTFNVSFLYIILSVWRINFIIKKTVSVAVVNRPGVPRAHDDVRINK